MRGDAADELVGDLVAVKWPALGGRGKPLRAATLVRFARERREGALVAQHLHSISPLATEGKFHPQNIADALTCKSIFISVCGGAIK
eukprot:4331931-Pyramimonas_sp.AAC.1